jgi:hypothetical protein
MWTRAPPGFWRTRVANFMLNGSYFLQEESRCKCVNITEAKRSDTDTDTMWLSPVVHSTIYLSFLWRDRHILYYRNSQWPKKFRPMLGWVFLSLSSHISMFSEVSMHLITDEDFCESPLPLSQSVPTHSYM